MTTYSSIYQITNVVNSKFYIGKTSKTVQERFRQHCYNHQNQDTHLYRAMRKYGVDKFIIEILEETESPNEREIYWIQTTQPHYNMTRGGDGGDTSHSPNYKLGMENRIHPHTPSYGMLGKKQSDRFMEAIKKSNCCPVVCEGVEYPSVGDAQKAYQGISIRNRLDNLKYPQFYRLRDKTLRS
jgi:group I intron endonuclease